MLVGWCHLRPRSSTVPVPNVRLVVGEKGERAGRSVQAVPHADAGMICEASLDLHGPDGEVQILEFLDLQVCREFAQINGEDGALHLAGQNILQAMPSALVTEDPQAIPGLIRRQKKRQALYVVPVSVSQ